MKIHRFNGNIFNRDDAEPLKVNGKPAHLQPLLISLLSFFVENPGRLIKKNVIIEAVWGSEEPSHGALSKAIFTLNQALPEGSKVTTIHGIGYAFKHKVVCELVKNDSIEYHLKHTPVFKVYLNIFIFIAVCALVVGAKSAFTSPDKTADASIAGIESAEDNSYTLENLNTLFTRDNVTGTPRLSPDGRFVLHRLADSKFTKQYLAIQDLQEGDSRQLVPMGFLDGFKWNLTGDKVVYQLTSANGCEVRLLTFKDQAKTLFDDKPLTSCYKTSGQLSFAWFNEQEFYVNFTGKEKITTANTFPQHHLYSFNINTHEKTSLLKADYLGGIGFYALEYDSTTNTLYLLQTANFESTDVYQYKNNQLSKITTLDYLVTHYTVDDNQLVYITPEQQFMLNRPATDFTNQKVLDVPVLARLSRPHMQGDKLAYMSGDVFNYTVHLWQKGKIGEIATQRFNPNVVASYHQQLVFTSNATGSHQVYLLNNNNEIKRISDFTKDEYIVDISVANDVFVISYDSRVDILQFTLGKLELVDSLANFQHGVLHPKGDKLLVATSNDKGERVIVEKHLHNLADTGRKTSKAKLAIYHYDSIVYLNSDDELLKLNNYGSDIIAVGVKPSEIYYIDANDSYFYYITRAKQQSVLNKIDLATGDTSRTILNDISATRIHLVGESVYIRSQIPARPELMLGDIMIN